MKINNLPCFRPAKRLQGNQKFVPKYRGRNSAPFKVVERGYTDLFPTRKHMEINNLPFFRLSERLREDRILYQNIGGKIQPPLKLVE